MTWGPSYHIGALCPFLGLVVWDYNAFWDDRNYLGDVRKVRASVFLVHGLNDWNVKTKQTAQWWYAPAADPNRLAYLTGKLPADVRISGTPTVTVRASLRDGSSPFLTALLVESAS